jgi:Flp pilus assembly secretin CpaC
MIVVVDHRHSILVFASLRSYASVRDQVVQYRNVGTQLTIRPTINADGYVTLSVLQEVNNATSETQFGAPVINTREAETQLMIKDGHTAVLGGLVDRQQESTNSGIPILKDIPILGVLFRSSAKQTTVNELFLLLTPHVLRTDADMDSAAVRVRERSEVLHELLGDSTLFEPPAAPGDSAGTPHDTIGRASMDTVRTRPPADTSSAPADTSVAPIDAKRARRDTIARRRGAARR